MKDDKDFVTESTRFADGAYTVIVKNKLGRHVVQLLSKEQTTVELAAEAVATALNKVMR